MRRRLKSIIPEFVEYIPARGEDLIPGIVYISMKHKTVVQRCPCRCGGLSEFMLDPIRFRMEYDGRNVSFYPSVGNSYLKCRSHYWIQDNQIQWCAPMADWETEQARRRELSRALEVHEKEDSSRRITIGNLLRRFTRWCSK